MKGLPGISARITRNSVLIYKVPIEPSHFRNWLLFAILFLIANASFAQGITGSITGTVTDASGSAVSGATVTVREVDTNLIRTVTTSDVGSYRVPQLAAGNYSVKVEAAGFEIFLKDKITLAIDQVAEIDAKLSIGSSTQTVNVSGDAPVIQTETSSVGLLVDSSSIQTTPLNGHVSILGLISLVPGVQDVAAQDQVPVRGVTLAFGTNQRNAYGDANFTYDGVINEEIELQRGEGEVPPLDAISQFKVITQGAPAEFNQANQTIIVSASGTNALHGEALEYNRSRGTAAKAWEDLPASEVPARPPYQRNEYGGNLSGPIYIPHLYNGKDRTFFFASYEGFHLTQSVTLTSTQPTTSERAGDFSCFLAGGSCATSTAGTVLKNPVTGQPYPGNIIDPSTTPFNSVDVQLQNLLMPLPTTSGTGVNTIELVPHTTEVSRFNLRVDHKISDQDQIRGTWLRAFYGPFKDVASEGAGSSLAGGVAMDGEHNDIFVAGWTHTFSPTLLLDSQISYLHLPLYRTAQNYKTDFSSIIPGLGSQILEGAPTVSITNITPFSEAGSKNLEQTYQGNTALTKVFPRHTIKAGFSYLYNDSWQQSAESHGSFGFNGEYTGIAFADFLLGYPATTGTANPLDFTVRFNSSQYGMYIQDDWKPFRNLTLNYGIRYDFQRFHDNPYGTESLFVPSIGKVVVFGDVYPASAEQAYIPDTVLSTSVGLPNNMYAYLGQAMTNVAPRFGFAYQIDPKTVIRGAVGQYYNLLPSSYMDTGFSNLPFVTQLTYTNTKSPTLTMNAPFAATASVPANPAVEAQHKTETPYTEQWNLAIERQLPGSVDLRVGYIGQRTIHQNNSGGPGNTMPDLNYAAPGDYTEQSQRPYQPFSTISYQIDPIFHTTTNSLQVGVHKQYKQGLMINAEYQWIRVLGVENFENPTNVGDSYGNISSITPQVLMVNYAYDFPLGRGKLLLGNATGLVDKIISGWQLAGFTAFESGQPFSVTYTAPGSQIYGASGRANRVLGVPIYPAHQTHAEWFNPAAFTAPPAYTFGTSGYNMLWGPHYQDWDMDLEKTITFADRYRVQFRGDVFNVANHPNFSVPSASISNPASEGVISSVVNENRTIEFGAKFNF
ncbi:carboxypeptidase regulatory-like domain-containing protein [Acidicapsa dinghuensis]|uniref:Carboxypeptidase regulatory-like domain-containing protein n=1 Tax=Acidicapsa dinghuensis TaxID=2218256 RepID=A0ABW1EGT3_9BACT|nr:carboxypeptidase regulatory-like domain-containing protein [Acidicapsa dinghuensis]